MSACRAESFRSLNRLQKRRFDVLKTMSFAVELSVICSERRGFPVEMYCKSMG